MAEKNIEVFISYIDSDQVFLEPLEKHLRPLSITIWHKGLINPGDNQITEKDMHFNAAQLILLLVSPDYLADNDCNTEMQRALDSGTRVIPIILGPSAWPRTKLSDLRPLPQIAHKIAKRISPKNDTIFHQIAEDIDRVIEEKIRKNDRTPPPGWEHITPEYLESKRLPYSQEKLVKFFDGRLPDWHDAQLPEETLPRRDIVGTLESTLEEARQEGEICVILLEGATGEGKSTALRQTVCNLVNKYTVWRVWWASKVDTYLRLPDANNLPISSSETLLIVADEASPIIGEICTAVQFLRTARKQHVVFLLSSQKLSWQAAQAAHLEWTKYVKDVQVSLPLSGISQAEAKLIVAAWAACDNEDSGLGKKLKDTPPGLRWLRFYEEAQSGPGRGRSLLGAALTARYTRKDLEKRILTLLDRLSTKEPQGDIVPSGKTLVKALAFICTVDSINAIRNSDDLHRFDNLKLTTDIFAQLFGCGPEQVYERFVIPLGEEAAANSIGNILYSRHQAIARVVIQHMQRLGMTFFAICKELMQAVCRLYSQGTLSNRDMTQWNQLPRWFFDTKISWLQQGEREDLGIMLVNVLIQAEQNNPVFCVDLSTFHRAQDDAEESIALLRSHFDRVDVDRKYYYEWATAEGYVGNKKGDGRYHLRDIWLSGVSLADVIHKKYAAAQPSLYKEDPVDVERATLSLAGLASALSNFLDQESIFLHACASAVRLGLLLNPYRKKASAKEQTKKSLLGNKNKCEKKGIVFPHQTLSQDGCSKEICNIKQGIIAAYIRCQDELPPDVPKGNELDFDKLEQCVLEYCAKS